MVAERALLVDLLLLRGQVLGRIVDYERAAELVEVLVRAALDEGLAWLARARTRATFHRFPEALADLHAAGRCGADRATLDAERAAILQAVGCYAEALVLRRAAVERRPDFASLGALAVLEAARGQVAEAERLFAEARCRYRGVSPLPVASLDFRRGLMWLGERDLPAARAWFDAAVRRVPAYAPALGHLAEIDAALGAHEAAIARLRPLAASSDDPEYPATLAGVLGDAGHPEEAEYWRSSAAARYDQLVLRHPEAFIDHAADFWLTVGDDPSTGLQLGRAQSRVPQHHEGGRRAPSPTAADRSVGAPQLSRYWCAGCAFRRQSLPGAVPSGGRTGCCGLRRLQPAFPELTALEGESDALLALGIAGGICDAGENCEDATETAAGRPLFGQFIAHDITADRSPLTHSTEFSDAINFRSPRADLECLYGSGPVGSPFLYRRDDPALLLLGRNDRGEEADVPRNSEGTALIGDPRNDSHVIVSQLHVAMIKVHNRLVKLARERGIIGADVFATAPRETIWHYQWVIVNDYLPRLVGAEIVDSILECGPRFYRPNRAPRIPLEFADAAFRYGHSQVRDSFQLNSSLDERRLFPT